MRSRLAWGAVVAGFDLATKFPPVPRTLGRYGSRSSTEDRRPWSARHVHRVNSTSGSRSTSPEFAKLPLELVDAHAGSLERGSRREPRGAVSSTVDRVPPCPQAQWV